MTLTLTPDQKTAIYDVLVEVCGAPRGTTERSFEFHFPQCVEFRFGGDLGPGGKVWADGGSERVYVTCYRDDETPERAAAIVRANTALADIVDPPETLLVHNPPGGPVTVTTLPKNNPREDQGAHPDGTTTHQV